MFLVVQTSYSESSFLPLRAGVFTSSSQPPSENAENEPTTQFEIHSILMPWRELQSPYVEKGEEHEAIG